MSTNSTYIGQDLTQEMYDNEGVFQGCSTYPTLFNIYIDDIKSENSEWIEHTQWYHTNTRRLFMPIYLSQQLVWSTRELPTSQHNTCRVYPNTMFTMSTWGTFVKPYFLVTVTNKKKETIVMTLMCVYWVVNSFFILLIYRFVL